MIASPGEWSNDPSWFSFQWWREEVIADVMWVRPWWLLRLVRVRRTTFRTVRHPIAGATTCSYTLLESDMGKRIDCRVTAHTSNGEVTRDAEVTE